MTDETWKDVKGYEGSYQVSDLGRVRSLKRVDSRGHKLKGKMLKLNSDKDGYLTVNLFLNGKKKTKTVHQLVAIEFLNHIPNGVTMVVDHVDNDRSNNRLDNLQIITHRENVSKDRNGRTSKYIGVHFDSNRNKFIAKCRHDYKQVYLGGFDSEIKASEAYNNFLKTII